MKQLDNAYLFETDWVNEYSKELKINVDENQPIMHVVENAYVLPTKGATNLAWGMGGVIDEKLNYRKESGISSAFGGYYDFDISRTEYIDESIVFIGIVPKQIGHFLIDTLCRLWFLKSKEYENFKIAFCSYEWDSNPIEDKYEEAFLLLGIDLERLLHINKPLKFKKIFIPEPTMSFGGRCNKAYREVVDRIITNSIEEQSKKNIPTFEKIYFNKRFYFPANMKQVGEKEIERAFLKNGYQVLSPEKMTLSEMVYIIHNCKEMACLSGTTSHYSMFHGKEFRLISLNRLPEPLKPQLRIDAIFEIDDCFVDVYNSHMLMPGNIYGKGVIWVELTDNLKKFFLDNNYVDCSANKLIKLRNYLEYNLKNVIYKTIPIVKRLIGRV